MLRLLPIEQKWIYNPADRRNSAVVLLMLGLVRPTVRSLAAVAGIILVAVVAAWEDCTSAPSRS